MGIKEAVNYKIYQLAEGAKGKFLQTIPRILVPRSQDLNNRLQIAITTYVDRYDSFFKPLYLSLIDLFPDVNIYVAVNGFHDQLVQEEYLSRIHHELCTGNMNGNTFVLHDKPVGLTRLWNELISQGNNDQTLILNDDLRIFPWFRSWIERKAYCDSIRLINGSWSHFFISKKVFDIIGCFDESFRGIGFEDMDYTARCGIRGVMIDNIRCQYIKHLDHQPTRTSFDDQSSTFWGPKYSSINHDTFFSKWKLSNNNSGVYIKQLQSYVLPNCRHEENKIDIELPFVDGVYYPDRT